MLSFTLSVINFGARWLRGAFHDVLIALFLLLVIFLFSWYYLRPSSRRVPRGLDENDIRQCGKDVPRIENTVTLVTKGITLLGDKSSGRDFPPKAAPGLQIIHDCGEPHIDIVAVHGLGANPDYAWVWLPKNNPADGDGYPDEPFNWLQQLLPTKLVCRVLAFNYDSAWISDAPQQRLSNISDILLESLRSSRDKEPAENRPLIFIGHSFGGNIIEQAIVSASRYNSDYLRIAECTVGVVFFGTPHRGSRAATWGTWIAWLASQVGDAEDRLLKALEHSDSLMDRLQDFSRWAFTQSVPLVSVFEQLSSDLSSRAGLKSNTIPFKELVVPEASACIDGHHKIALHADHFKLNKFYGTKDPSFKLLYPAIVRLAHGASKVLERRRNPRAIPTDESSASGDLRKWLQQMRVRNPEDILSDIKRQKGDRVGHSCEWILKREEFLAWSATEESQLLRLTGSPGIGKTMMATFLVDVLKSKAERAPNMAFVYFFCDDKDQDRKTPTAMIRSLIWQLLLQRQELFHHLKPDLEKHAEDRVFGSVFDDFSALWRILRHMLQDERAGEVVILIDALDECESSAREKFLVELRHFFSSSLGGGLWRTKLLITSRPGIHDIERQLKVVGKSLRMDSAEINDDLSEYIDIRVNEMTDLDGNEYPPLLRKKVRVALKDKAGGTFLWVSLMLAELGSVLMSEVEEKLNDLPRGLDNIYAAILNRIPPKNRETAQFILWCMVATRYPLKEVEIQAAFAAWKTGSAQNGEELSIYKDIFAVCRSILDISSGDHATISFCHQTVKEFLLQGGSEVNMWYHTTENEANSCIFKACWAYLSAEVFDHGNLLVRRDEGGSGRLHNRRLWELQDHFSQQLFLEYSCGEWDKHAIASSTTLLEGLAIDTAKAPTLRDAWLQRATEVGAEAIVQKLLQLGAMITTDMNNMTPMHYAVSRSDKELVQCFLNAHVHIDIAVQRRRWQEMDQGQDMPAHGDEYEGGLTSLHYSALTGSYEMTDFLLLCGANPNAVSEYGETPLHLALKRDLAGARWRGYLDYWSDTTYRVEDILNFIDDPEDDTEHHKAHSIIEEHRERVFALLLAHSRTDVTIQDIDGASPLHSVIYGNRESPEIIKRLVKKGADTSARNNRGQTALHLACFKGDVPAIVTFLDLGADGAATDHEGINCLHYAAKSGNINAIHKILGAGAVNGDNSLAWGASRDMKGRNALHHLAMKFTSMDHKLLQYFLELGVTCNALDNEGMSALAYHLSHSCSCPDAVQVAQRLLENGSDVAFKTRTSGLNLAHIHAKSSIEVQVELLRLLARFGVDIQETDNDGRSVLHHCAMSGSLTQKAFNFLYVEIGLTMTAEDVHGETPLQYAIVMKQKPRHPDTFDGGRWSRTERILLDAAQKADGITNGPG